MMWLCAIIKSINNQQWKIKIKNKQSTMTKHAHRTLIALQSSNFSEPTLILSTQKISDQINSGKLLKRTVAREEANLLYQLRGLVQFEKSKVLWSTQIECRQQKNVVTISRSVLQEKWKAIESEDSQQIRLEDYNIQCEEDFEFDQTYKSKRGRPKGVRNRKRQNNNNSLTDSEEEDDEEGNKRRRGRPKGSRNKATQGEEISNNMRDVKKLLSKHLRNFDIDSAESKEYPEVQVKVEQDSKDKKVVEEAIEKEKRSRGRPKGVKNKPKSEPENDEQSDEAEEYVLPLPLQSNIEVMDCCLRCTNRKFKESLLGISPTVFKRTLNSPVSPIYNLSQDFSMENRTNLIIECIKKNMDAVSFELLLSKLSSFKPYFICSWEYEGRIEKLLYTIRTNKNYLSQTGKEGNNALSHDCDVRPGVWWRQIGVERLLEAMSNGTDRKLVDALRNHDPELKKAMEENIPTLIRCGNHEIAKYLLSFVVPTGFGTYGFSKEHLQCLSEKTVNTSLFKKINLLKQNFGSNFCSPIHCAAMNPNPKLLETLLKSLHDYNVSDSSSRKPVHYAVLAKTTGNLEVLVANKCDLKLTDKQRITPLMIAAMYGKHENLAFLMGKGCDALYINFRCKQGLSALHYAIINEHLQCVKVLINHHLVELELEGKDKLTPLHLAAGTGNVAIIHQLINAKHHIDPLDKFKRTPLFFSIRNNNHAASYQLLKHGAKYYKKDTSLNSLIHYCAAYGNTVFLQHLLPHININKNKQKYYPWDIAVGKGHMACIKLLENQSESSEEAGNEEGNNKNQNQNESEVKNKSKVKSKYKGKKPIDGPSEHMMCFMNMKNIRYVPQSMEIIKYLINGYYSPESTDSNGSRLVHYICGIGQQDYVKYRQSQTGRSDEGSLSQFQVEHSKLTQQLISELDKKGLQSDIENKRGESPITLCLQKENMLGLRLLLKDHLNLQFESSKGYTLLHYFSHLASESSEDIQFVLERLQPKEDKKTEERNKLRDALKRTDVNGFEAILIFVKDFTYKVKENFNRRIGSLEKSLGRSSAVIQSFEEFQEHERLFVKLLTLLVDLGCDANVFVQDKRGYEQGETFKKWGILHFMMKFPSLVLLELLRNKIRIRDFNATNNNGMTPLHLFCQEIRHGCLFEIDIPVKHDNYLGEKSLQFLLENGCAPNIIDSNRSIPLLYASLNRQIQFVFLLRHFSSSINNCNNCNQVPLIEIIKMKNHFNFSDLQTLLKKGADPNTEDLNKQTALHHLVSNSVNLDNSTELCKLFFDHGAKINSLDKYHRTPLFYCFTKIDGDENEEPTHDKIEILQMLLNHPDININHQDVFHKTALHYACEQNYFFSILYLLDKRIDINIKDYQENTPLAVCLKHKRLNQAALLIKRGVSQGYIVDGDVKLSYFAYAVTKLSVGICCMLLDHGYPIEKALLQAPNEEFRSLLLKKYGKKE